MSSHVVFRIYYLNVIHDCDEISFSKNYYYVCQNYHLSACYVPIMKCWGRRIIVCLCFVIVYMQQWYFGDIMYIFLDESVSAVTCKCIR